MRRTLGLFLFFLISYLQPLKAQQIQKPPSNHYNQGVNLFNKGLYEQSGRELEEFITQQPDHELDVSAQYYLARSQAHLDSVNRLDYFEAFISTNPYSDFSTKLLFAMADDAEQQQNYGKAVSYYQRAISLGAGSSKAPQAYYWAAEASASDSSYQQARSYFLSVANEYPKSDWAPKALYARGRLFLTESRYDSATKAFELIKTRYPNGEMSRRIGTALGESYYQQGKFAQAIKSFQSSMPYLEGDSKSKAVLLTAESYNFLKKFDQAANYYLQYINLNKGTPKVRNAQYGLGWVYNKQEIYHWASDEFGKAAKGTDNLARKALYYKAANEKLGSRYAEAMDTFREFGKRFKKGFWVEKAYYEWSITAYEMGNYAESIEVLLKLVRGDDQLEWEGKVYTMLGRAYFANKEYTRSIQAFEAAEKVTDIDPKIKRKARFQKAWVQYNNRAFKQAQPVFQSLNKQVPETKLGKESLFWSADAYYHMKNYGRSSSQYSEFIKQYPNHQLVGPAYYSLAWSYFKMGNYEKAIAPFKTFLQKYDPPEVSLYPYDTDSKLRIGDSYYAMDDYASAITSYQKAVRDDPGGDYAMFQIANSYYRAKKTYEAVTNFRKFLRIYPKSKLREQGQYNIAYIYLNSGNYSQAIEEFKTVINKYPNTSWAARAQYNIGDAFYNAGDYTKAIASYKKVMEKYPNSDYIIEAANGIEYSQLSEGKADSSSAVLEAYLADNPQTSTADRLRYRQADNRLQTGDYQGAIDEFSQYIRITNNRKLLPDAHFNLANAYEKTGDLAKAKSEYQTIVQDYSDSKRIGASLAALGSISFSQGGYQQSYNYFNQLLKEGNKYRLDAYIGMGNAELEMDNISEARKQYKEALNIDKNYAPAKVGLAKVSLRQNNYTDTEELLSPVAEASTTEIGAEAQYLLGVMNYQQGNYKQAIKELANVSVLYETYSYWVAKALLKKAKSYIQLGQTGEARSALKTIVEEYPDTPQLKEAQRLLNEK